MGLNPGHGPRVGMMTMQDNNSDVSKSKPSIKALS